MNNQKKNYIIGVDIGGTKMSAVLFDGEKVLADYVLATPKDNREHFMIMLKALIEPLEDKAKADGAVIKGIGLGIAGMLDYKENMIVEAPNIPILNLDIVANRICFLEFLSLNQIPLIPFLSLSITYFLKKCFFQYILLLLLLLLQKTSY